MNTNPKNPTEHAGSDRMDEVRRKDPPAGGDSEPEMVECKNCDGMGEVILEDEDGRFEGLCPVCKGVCEVPKENKQ